MRILVSMGTRPEVIKLAPVVRALRARPGVTTRVLFTGQHRHLLDQMACFFGLAGNEDLRVMREAQSLPALTGIRGVLEARPDALLVYPVHPNPQAQAAARAVLGDVPNARLVEPLSYGPFVSAMKRSTIILTDSGGVREEAPSLGVPVLVLRDRTERPEGVAAGMARLVGTDGEAVRRHALQLLDDPAARDAMRGPVSLYGDGKAAGRIARVLTDEVPVGPR